MLEKLKKYWQHITRRMSLSGLVGVVVVFVVVSLVFGSVQAIQENFQRQIEVDTAAQEVALLEVENETIRFQNQYYQSNEYLELQARKLLNKAAPGEKVIILPATTLKAPEQNANNTMNDDIPIKDRSNFEQCPVAELDRQRGLFG